MSMAGVCRFRVKWKRWGSVKKSHQLEQRVCVESSRNKFEATEGCYHQGNQGRILMRYGSNKEPLKK